MLISKFDTTNIEIHITEFENNYRFKFPEQYKNFLISHNGGETPKSKFKINKVSSDIKGFFGLGKANKHYNYSIFTELEEIQEFIKDNLIPIGLNTFGDYIMIGINKENLGNIYFCYHDQPREYIKLAEDFKTFISKCKSEKIGHIKSIEERKELLIKNGNEENITPGWIEIWQKEIDKYANIKQEKLIL